MVKNEVDWRIQFSQIITHTNKSNGKLYLSCQSKIANENVLQIKEVFLCYWS